MNDRPKSRLALAFEMIDLLIASSPDLYYAPEGVDKELDNAECRAALLEASSHPPLDDVTHPVEMGALLWHGFVEVEGGAVYLTPEGQKLMALWHPRGPQTA